MLKCDDRFARQNRDGPPPEFPLASPSSSIVHHLSGPIGRAPTRTTSAVGRRRTPLRRARGLLSRSLSLRLLLSSEPRTRAHVRLVGPCFKTGPMQPPSLDSGLRNRSAALLPAESSGERVRPRRGRLPISRTETWQGAPRSELGGRGDASLDVRPGRLQKTANIRKMRPF